MKRSAVLWPLLALVAVLVFNALATPGFFAIEVKDGRLFGSLIDILNRAAPVALLSIGMTLVIATGGVDLSVGAVMAICGSVAASLIARPAGNVLLGVPVNGSAPAIVAFTLAIAITCGIWNGLLVSRLRIQPIVATLLLMVAGRGVAQLISNGQIVIFSHPGFESIGSGASAGMPNPVWTVLGALVVVGLLTRKTALGLFIESVGSNSAASRLAGVDDRTIKLFVYVVCALCAGMAGLIGTADIKAADANNLGLYLELDAILAVAIGGAAMAGGRFSLIGSVVGAVLMQAITTTILTRGVPFEITLMLKAIVVIAVCSLQSPIIAAKLRRTEA